MPIFELIGAALDFTPLNKYTEEYHLTNSSYSSIIGDNTAFIIGGGRNTNIYGTDVKLLIDWEEFIVNYATGGSSSATLSNIGMKGLGLLFGIGGDTGLLIGNKSDFKYWGEDFSVARQRHEFKCTVPQSNHHEVPVPFPVKIALGLGTIGLLLASLIARFEFGLYSTASATQYPLNTSIVATVIPAFETRWLFVMKLIEYGLSFLSATESDLVAAKAALADAEAALSKAEKSLKTLTSSISLFGRSPTADALEAAEKSVASCVSDLEKCTKTVEIKNAARIIAGDTLVGSAAVKKAYADDLKKKAADKALSPITTQITADQYGITCNTFTINDNKSLINLVSADSKIAVASPVNDTKGSIILKSSTITLDSNGNSSIKMIGGDLNLENPTIILTTNGLASSTISMVANAANIFGASITASTKGVIISHGVEGDQGLATITNKAINLSVGVPDVGPTIRITPESIIFQVGETIMTITAEGILIVATAVEVVCEDTNVLINTAGIFEEVAEITREVSAEGHNMMAAEVEVNIGVSGITDEAPMATMEFEATTKINSLMIDEIADAILSIDAAVAEIL